jgi:hypothetical protein
MTASSSRGYRRWLQGGFAVLCACLCMSPCFAVSYPDDAVKAAFLYRFAGYIEWPSEREPSIFTIAVLGADGVVEHLNRLLPQTINNRPARVRKLKNLAERGDAQVVLIGSGQAARLQKAIAGLATNNVLVVTDENGGLALGSTINFLQVDRRIRFEISLPAAHRSRLKISSELLAVAMRVQSSVPGFAVPCAMNDSGTHGWHCRESVSLR